MQSSLLANCHILVTGAAGEGVGRGVCEAIVEAGGVPVINDLSGEAAASACARYPQAIAAPADISDETEVLALFAELEQRDIRLDGLVNNAGVGLCCPSHAASTEQFDTLFGIDVRGLWLVTRSFARQCQAHGTPGAVVNVSSVHTRASIGNYALYAAAKGAVEAYTRAAALELAALQIRVNAIAPGYIHSEQNLDLIGNWAQDPQQWVDFHSRAYQAIEGEMGAIECGRPAVFLLSALASAVTGQTLVVDKGTTSLLYDKHFIPSRGKWSPDGLLFPTQANEDLPNNCH